MAKCSVTIEKLTDLIHRVDIVRSTVYVAAAALDHGETDLELQSATALKDAFETISEAYDELVAMRNHALFVPRLKGIAALSDAEVANG